MHSRTKDFLQSCICAVHMEFVVFKYRKPELEGLVYYLICYAAFDCNQVRVEQPKIDEMWLSSHSPRLLHLG